MPRARVVVLAAFVGGCLPGDLRPEPASIYVTGEPSDATAHGFTTDDGWAIRFDRFVTALGDVRLQGVDEADAVCSDYEETRYDWLFDFTVAGREKVALVFGLGPCSVEFRLRDPSRDTVLGPGATAADSVWMDESASDPHADDEDVALYLEGHAERDGVVKTFTWTFRRSYRLFRCPTPAEDGFVSIVDLVGGDALELAIVVSGEELFRAAPFDDQPLGFDRLAAADADADDDITLAELDDVPLLPVPGVGPFHPEVAFTVPITLGQLVYEALLPRVARLAGGGPCQAELRDRR
jgi:hypothetical protein